MKKTYEVGKICDRCGMEREEAKRLQYECGVYGTHYGKHLWNKEPRTVEVRYFNTKPSK